MKNGRRKGSKFELDMVKEFTKWTGIPWEKTFRSGGGKQKGDILPVNKGSRIILELKNRESWDHKNFFDGKGPIYSWWDKVVEEASSFQCEPVLILKKNYSKALVCCSPSLLKHLKLKPLVILPQFSVIPLAYLLTADGSKILQ